ncbi:hypothetical protein [Bradyrhizobium japonicum]|uniref:hypothetical protein n=1 Tax=Bradyrhizobium japonicum TaxID=375 RepID=UPI00200C7134|nr:hypothetical protein [Bradyrhizobium japonicum]UQE01116.1 hypothetical protein JEY30_13790 [Bradyrhizobium japonicum]
MSGKIWIEHLCRQLDINAIELHKHMLEANRAERSVHVSTLRKHFLKQMAPAPELQMIVRSAVSRLHAEDVRKPAWNQEVHSYPAFKNGKIPVPAPLSINIQTAHEDDKANYAGTYVLLRKNFSNALVAELLRLKVRADRTGTFDTTLLMREGGKGVQAGAELLEFQGNAHLTITSIWGYGVCVNQGHHECLSFSIARNENENPEQLAGLVLRRSSKDGAPVAQTIFLKRCKKSLPAASVPAYLSSVEAAIGEDAKALKKCFGELRAERDVVQDALARVPAH